MKDEPEDIGYVLTDPPESPYSSLDEIRQWIRELELMSPAPAVTEALEQARSLLAKAQKSK